MNASFVHKSMLKELRFSKIDMVLCGLKELTLRNNNNINAKYKSI